MFNNFMAFILTCGMGYIAYMSSVIVYEQKKRKK